MKITFYGHASLGIQVGGKYILVDPYISANPSAAHIDIETLKADYILVTHAHGDHILDVEAIAKRTNAIIVSNAEIAGYYSQKGFQSHPMNHGGSWNFDFGKVNEGTIIIQVITSLDNIPSTTTSYANKGECFNDFYAVSCFQQHRHS